MKTREEVVKAQEEFLEAAEKILSPRGRYGIAAFLAATATVNDFVRYIYDENAETPAQSITRQNREHEEDKSGTED